MKKMATGAVTVVMLLLGGRAAAAAAVLPPLSISPLQPSLFLSSSFFLELPRRELSSLSSVSPLLLFSFLFSPNLHLPF